MKHKTNIELVTEMMSYSKQGVLMQAFIIEAIANYAERVQSALKDAKDENAIISPHAWLACADEAIDAINNRNKETV